MNRFLKSAVLLTVALLLVESALNAALDRLGRSPAQDSFTWYDATGVAVVAYDGPQALEQKIPRPAHPATSFLFHRTAGTVACVPNPAASREQLF